MSTNIKTTSDIQLLATYGTLRDDDNSGAAWTNDFVKDISGAVTGKLVGYRLFGHSVINYPFAIFTGDSNDSLVVRLLSWPSNEQFEERIQAADIIEGDEYERRAVEVIVNDEIKHAYIYISKLASLDNDWKSIPSGDWLQRHLI
ncbi:unnamed protein product [Adineta steineri]|uniref:Gamma-glutamylcyclotransferase AIG2-like domain-containing protein n=1 Tax=Adineta steineri TaxID=433720 RepID=A0A815CHA4_9BILA|nr:unnamed protein product [Adineta steineri]CAF1284036.1 unnamed protein product [Adineta steineri]CAF3682695.1 unnamed protein product [Adineta steineri]CAF3979460.1 unnamed protein product [Adineta steineri]